MEQLPPKAPITMAAHNWPSFPFQTPPSAAAAPWMDEFLDFSTTRRSSHRRTVSDPIAFVEDVVAHGSGGGMGFDRLDDEQLRNMFSDDLIIALGSSSNPSSVNPSTPSDQNSDDDEKRTVACLQPKAETGEVDSSDQPAPDPTAPQTTKSSENAPGDPKRIKRILANRQSAQRSRVRKLQYISELERSVTTLQTEVSALSPRVAFLDHQRLLLNVDNSAIKQRIAALAQDKIFKDAHQEALKKEIERLRKVFHVQNMKKNMECSDAPPPEPRSEEE
ncbi:basic leucine zipper 61-like [Salvia divinorum]|uniref:Basic leucine zipper 61-like n=1 Tax=Salvia divinorum TaxID=28513 RepID=A0ABD1G1H6_SALDI